MKWGAIFALLTVVLLGALLALPTVVWADGVCPCPGDTVFVVKCEWNTNAYLCTEGDGDAITFGDGTDADGGTSEAGVYYCDRVDEGLSRAKLLTK